MKWLVAEVEIRLCFPDPAEMTSCGGWSLSEMEMMRLKIRVEIRAESHMFLHKPENNVPRIKGFQFFSPSDHSQNSGLLWKKTLYIFYTLIEFVFHQNRFRMKAAEKQESPHVLIIQLNFIFNPWTDRNADDRKRDFIEKWVNFLGTSGGWGF